MTAGFVALLTLPRLLDRSPALVLDEFGVTDNSTILANGFIPWAEIRELYVGEAESQRLLFVILNSPNQCLSGKSWIKRLLAKAAEKRGDPSPVSIHIGNLALSEAELVQHLNRYVAATSSVPPAT